MQPPGGKKNNDSTNGLIQLKASGPLQVRQPKGCLFAQVTRLLRALRVPSLMKYVAPLQTLVPRKETGGLGGFGEPLGYGNQQLGESELHLIP